MIYAEPTCQNTRLGKNYFKEKRNNLDEIHIDIYLHVYESFKDSFQQNYGSGSVKLSYFYCFLSGNVYNTFLQHVLPCQTRQMPL